MKKIRILSDFEISCIAAGEVVENTGSIIKELVENAVDAGADTIKVFFNEGGTKKIIVIDNGCGMSLEDLSMAFVPHATSKLQSLDVLYNQNNVFFGFRGEALSAIAGVAKVSIISKEKNADCGFSLIVECGKFSLIEKVASNNGTTVIVENLFDKVPARKKYLTSVKNQEKNILYVVTGLVLAHPKINFFIYKDSKIYREYRASEDFLSRSYQLITDDTSRYMPIVYEDMYMKLEGLMSDYEYGHYDRSKIFILANNRLIKQYKITQSCIKAYNSENFAKKYPLLFLSITVSPDQIDINVHPRKEEVLFLYQKRIEQLLTEILVKAFDERTQKLFDLKYISNQDQSINNSIKIINDDIRTKLFITESTPVLFQEELSCNINDVTKELLNHNIDNSFNQLNKTINNNLQLVDKKEINLINNNSENIDNKNINDKIKDNLLESSINFEIFSQNNYLKKDTAKVSSNNLFQLPIFQESSSLGYLGIFANTYLILVHDDYLLFIDQHALHEKILYENYINNFIQKKTMPMQSLLFEEKILIDERQKELLIMHEGVFNSVGINYVINENNIIISTYPINLLKFSIKETVLNFLTKLSSTDFLSFDDKQKLLLHEMAALYGCKNAIKAGDKLDSKEVNFLLQSITKMKSGVYCPHGRPIYYQMNLSEMHSLFKRK